MTAGENNRRILLPESGVVLTSNDFSWVAPNGASLSESDLLFGKRSDWFASFPCGFSEIGSEKKGSREECIAFLDRAMLAAQRDVLPTLGFVVVDDEATVERIVRAFKAWVGVYNEKAQDAAARAVLAALKKGR